MFHFDLCQSVGITHELEENMEPSASSILIYMLNQKVKMNLCHVESPAPWPRNKRQPGEFFFFFLAGRIVLYLKKLHVITM